MNSQVNNSEGNLLVYDNLGIKTLLRVSSKYLWQIFGLISLIIIQRNYGYEVIGMMAYAIAYVHIFQIISDLGYTSAHSKRLNEGNLDEGKCNGTYITIRLALNFITTLVILLSILIPKYVYNYQYESKTLEILLYLSIIHIFIININETFHGLFNAKLEVAKKVVPTTIGRFIQMIIKCTISIFFSHKFGVLYLVGAEIFSVLIILLLFTTLIRKYKFKKFDYNYFKKYSTFAIPVIFMGFVGSMNHYFDKIMIQMFLGSKEVGIYVISERIALFFLIISSSIIKLLFPTFSNLYSNKKYIKINKISNSATKYISLTIVPPILFLFIFGDNILKIIFGPEAIQSVNVLRVLLIAIFIYAISNPYIVQITSTGHLKIALFIDSISLISNVILNCIFIPKSLFGIKMIGMGALGASFTYFFSISFKAIMSKYYAKKITQTKGYTNIWKHIIAALLTSLCAINFLFLAHIWYLLPFLFSLILLINISILFFLKEFGRIELNFYLSVLNYNNITKYMKSELNQ